MDTITSTAFNYKGIEVPGLEASRAFIQSLGGEEGFEQRFYNKLLESFPYTPLVGLNEVGRDLHMCRGLQLPSELERVPNDAKKLAKLIHSKAREQNEWGTCYRSVVQYLPRSETPRGMRQPRDKSYDLALFFDDVTHIRARKKGFDIESEDCGKHMWLPQGDCRTIVPRGKRVYNDHGFPLRTESDPKLIYDSWCDYYQSMGIEVNQKKLEKSLSTFVRNSPSALMDKPACAVLTWSMAHYGALCTDGSYSLDDIEGSTITLPFKMVA